MEPINAPCPICYAASGRPCAAGCSYWTRRTGTLPKYQAIDAAIAWVHAHPDSKSVLGYYVSAEDGKHDHSHVYCERHASEAAELLTSIRRVRHYVSGCWAGDDSPRRCQIVTCALSLDTGGLTDVGIDDAIGLTEGDDPCWTPTVAELALAAESMGRRDPRWWPWLLKVQRIQRMPKPKPSREARTLVQITAERDQRRIVAWLYREGGRRTFREVGEMLGVGPQQATYLVHGGARILSQRATAMRIPRAGDPPWMTRLRAAGALPKPSDRYGIASNLVDTDEQIDEPKEKEPK